MAGGTEFLRPDIVLPTPPTTEHALVMDPNKEEKHGIPRRFEKVSLRLESYDHTVLDSYVEFILRSGKACQLDLTGRINLPTKMERWTLLKSVHVHKQHRAQYERRTHRRLVQIRGVSGQTATVFLDYVLRHIPPGLQAKIAHQTDEAPEGELAAQLAHLLEADDVKQHTHALNQAEDVVTTRDLGTLLVEELSEQELDEFGKILDEYTRGNGKNLKAFHQDLKKLFGPERAHFLSSMRTYVTDPAEFDAMLEHGL